MKNIFNRDYGHMFWFIREYLWKEQFVKLDEGIDVEEYPFRYLGAGLCFIVVCFFFSISFAFKYIVFGEGSAANWHEYIRYQYEKTHKRSE